MRLRVCLCVCACVYVCQRVSRSLFRLFPHKPTEDQLSLCLSLPSSLSPSLPLSLSMCVYRSIHAVCFSLGYYAPLRYWHIRLQECPFENSPKTCHAVMIIHVFIFFLKRSLSLLLDHIHKNKVSCRCSNQFLDYSLPEA